MAVAQQRCPRPDCKCPESDMIFSLQKSLILHFIQQHEEEFADLSDQTEAFECNDSNIQSLKAGVNEDGPCQKRKRLSDEDDGEIAREIKRYRSEIKAKTNVECCNEDKENE